MNNDLAELNQELDNLNLDNPILEEDNQLDSDTDSINTVQSEEPELDMGDQALQAAADAITILAEALGIGSKKTLFKIESFHSDSTQDPITWLEEFEQATKANRWSPAYQLELASAYLKDNAQEWF